MDYIPLLKHRDCCETVQKTTTQLYVIYKKHTLNINTQMS